MKILYVSVHSVLEYDELQLFTDLGHDCFSLGAYHSLGGDDLPRPAVKGLVYHEDLDKIYVQNPNHNQIQQELIDWADVIIFMHAPHPLFNNWERIKHKRVIWRSIGQSVAWIERKLKPLFVEGLEIVRYSPKERNIMNYAGETAMIRFYKDENIYKGWTGENRDVVSFNQGLMGRRDFCHYDEIMHVIQHFGGKVYGPDNEDLGEYYGGKLPYEKQIEVLQKSAAIPYGGTWPASYTLSFIEALMVGTPVVAISKALAHIQKFEGIDFYEVDELLAEISGLVCDNVGQMVTNTSMVVNQPDVAMELSKRQRELAIKHFGKANISKQWEALLCGSENVDQNPNQP